MPLPISLERVYRSLWAKSQKLLPKIGRGRSIHICSSSPQHAGIQVYVDVKVTQTVEILTLSPLSLDSDSFSECNDDRDSVSEDFYSAYSVLVPTLVDSPFQSPRRIHGYSSHLNDSCYQHGHQVLDSSCKDVSTNCEEEYDEDLEDDTTREWVTEPFESRYKKLVESGILVPA